MLGNVSMTHHSKLKWHCRRGMRELDLLLEGLLENRYEHVDVISSP